MKGLPEFMEYIDKALIEESSYQLQHLIMNHWKNSPERPDYDRIIEALKSTGKYVIDKGKTGGNLIISRNPLFKVPTWEEKHPTLDRFRTGGITAVFSLLVGILLFLLTRSCQTPKDTQQDKRLDSLDSLITNLQKHIKDSASR